MYRKGARKERELADFLRKKGFGVVRGAGSSAPDLVAGKSGKFYVIECKFTTKDVIYVPWEEVEREIEIARKMGAIFLLAIKFSREPWRFASEREVKRLKRGKSVRIYRGEAGSLPSVELLLDKNLNEYVNS